MLLGKLPRFCQDNTNTRTFLKPGKLEIKCFSSSSLKEVPDDLLQKSTSFNVRIGVDINNDEKVTKMVNIFRKMKLHNKPIILRRWFNGLFDSHDEQTIRKILEKYDIDVEIELVDEI